MWVSIFAMTALAAPCVRPICAVTVAFPDQQHTVEAVVGGPSFVAELEPGMYTNTVALLSVTPQPDDVDLVEVRYRNRASITVMDEGPHVDLIDWRQGVGPWAVATASGTGFTIPAATVDAKPDATGEEIARHVLATTQAWEERERATRWADLARSCAGPESYPCAVGVSHVDIEIRAFEVDDDGDTKLDRFMVTLVRPMGC